VKTLAYVLLLFGVLVGRAATKGRSFTQVPGDIGDLLVGVISADQTKVKEVLARTGTGDLAPPVDTPLTITAGQDALTPATGAVYGGGLLAECVRLGSAALGYKWGATGPNYYDCSGLVWVACKNLGIYSGARFITTTFPVASRSWADKVATPAVGDVVLWPGHMGVVSGPDAFYSAASSKIGIVYGSISGFGGKPTYYRVRAAGIASAGASANAIEHALPSSQRKYTTVNTSPNP
jgi:hypothetical protein